MAGTGVGIYSSMAEGSESVVRLDREFVPNAEQQRLYDARFDAYRRLWPLMKDYLREIA
jgi:sugar (pentulose or hexulose) kinase